MWGTFEENRAWLLSDIAVSRDLIRAVDVHYIKKYPDADHSVAWEVIDQERAIIKESMSRLVKLKKEARVNEQHRLSQEANT